MAYVALCRPPFLKILPPVTFVCERQQRVKICDIFSDWVTLRGGMPQPQGTWLGPLTFTILIDDLRPGLLTHKYVDDTTVTEMIEKGSVTFVIGEMKTNRY